jgi:energy-coupling factor transporter transmembrane protein EcfT
MPFLRYAPLDTFIHRFHPFSKFVFLFSYIVILSVFYEPVTVAIALLSVIIIGVLAKFNSLKTIRTLASPLFMIFVLSIINSLWMYKPEMYVNLPKGFATTVLAELTPEGTPILGKTAITVGGVIYAFALSIRALAGVLVFSLFVHVTSMSEILYGLGSIGVPRLGVFIFMATYRLFPLFLRDINTTIEAQTLRGWKLDSRNPLKQAGQYMAMTVPAFNELTVVSENLGMAAESRAFGAGKFSTYHDISVKPLDYLAIALLIGAAVTSVFVYSVYRIGML